MAATRLTRLEAVRIDALRRWWGEVARDWRVAMRADPEVARLLDDPGVGSVVVPDGSARRAMELGSMMRGWGDAGGDPTPLRYEPLD